MPPLYAAARESACYVRHIIDVTPDTDDNMRCPLRMLSMLIRHVMLLRQDIDARWRRADADYLFTIFTPRRLPSPDIKYCHWRETGRFQRYACRHYASESRALFMPLFTPSDAIRQHALSITMM